MNRNPDQSLQNSKKNSPAAGSITISDIILFIDRPAAYKYYDWHGCIITDIPIVADCLEFTVCLLSRSACLHAHVLSLLNYVLHEIYFA